MDFKKFDVQTDDPVSFAGGYIFGKYRNRGWNLEDGAEEKLFKGTDTSDVCFRQGYEWGQKVAAGAPRPEWDDAENDEIYMLIQQHKISGQQVAGRILKGAVEGNKIPVQISNLSREEILRNAELMIAEKHPDAPRDVEVSQGSFEMANPFENFEFPEGCDNAVAFMSGYIYGLTPGAEFAYEADLSPGLAHDQEQLAMGYHAGRAVREGAAKPPWHVTGIDQISALVLARIFPPNMVRQIMHQMALDAGKHDCKKDSTCTLTPEQQAEIQRRVQQRRLAEALAGRQQKKGGWYN